LGCLAGISAYQLLGKIRDLDLGHTESFPTAGKAYSGILFRRPTWKIQSTSIFDVPRTISLKNAHLGCLCSGRLVAAPVTIRAQLRNRNALKSWIIFRPNQIARGSHGLRRKPFRD